MLFAGLVNTGDSIQEYLHGSKHGGQDCPFALKHSRHVAAERNHEGTEDREVDRDLNPAIDCHDVPLRTAQGAAGRR